MKGTMKKFRINDANLLRLIIMFVLVFVVMSALKPDVFLRSWNLVSMMKQFPEYGIMAIGISLAMITGGIDLAVVGTANLSAIITAKFLIAMVPKGSPSSVVVPMLIVSLLIAVTTGVVAGLINGTLISRFHIPAILATLGTQQLFTGIAIVLTAGRPISGLPILLSKIGNKTVAGFLPMPFLIYVVVALATGILLSRTRLGRQIFLVGTNPTASRFAGISNTAVLIKTYVISGVLSSLAGLIMMARVNSAKADYGSSYTLQCVLIAVLGGVNPNGGFGNIAGVTMGILILQVLSSGLNMFENVSNFYRDVIWGAVLIMVLIMSFAIDRRNQKRALMAKAEAGQ